MRLFAAWWLALYCCLVSSVASVDPEQKLGGRPLPLPGLHNVYRITDKLFSGSSPDGDEGFRSLQKLGVKTIISVDGARPDVEAARKYELRYVHIPIGYDGVPREQAVRIAKAVRDLPGPVYIHCHHGKHRGPAAAAVVHLCLDANCHIDDAVAEMRRAGTDARYTGLYASPKELRRPTRKELDEIASEFPEVASVPALAQHMVAIDQHHDNLALAKAAGWQRPPDHPDIDPPHEALQLLEHYRESARLPATAQRPEAFRRLLADAEKSVHELEQLLRDFEAKKSADRVRADQLLGQIGAQCADCHARYRDVPRRP